MTNKGKLWPWCLDVYARAGVQPLCLEAQDRYGVDVCLLLCGLWLELRGISPHPARLQALEDCAADWRSRVVLPLRQIRRDWKPAAQDDVALGLLRTRLQQLEIDAEHELLDRLEALASVWDCDQSSADWLAVLLPQLPAGRAWQLRRLAQS